MARECPHCGVVIDKLREIRSTSGWEERIIFENGEDECGDSEMTDSTHDGYQCLECGNSINTHGEEPQDWLMQGTEAFDDDGVDTSVWSNAQ